MSALVLQSATAVAIMVSNFVSAGTLRASVGLAVCLGADVGSALLVKLLFVKQTFMIPLLLLLGAGLFLRGQSRRVRQLGRILIGLALIFVSLDMIRSTTEPLVNSPGLASVMSYLGTDLATAFIVGAIFTWLVHSSVAAILLVATLVSQGVMPQSAAVAMVLGANLGGVIIAYVLTLSAGLVARQMIAANALIRGGGAILLLTILGLSGASLNWLGATDVAQVINLHLAFNLGIALIALPFLKLAIGAIAVVMPDRPKTDSLRMRPTALDKATLSTPDKALSCAARKILYMGEIVAGMLRAAMPLYRNWEEPQAQAIRADALEVSKAHGDTKLFLARLNQGGLDEAQSKRSLELSTVAMNMDAAADVITRNMLGLAQRLEDEPVKFSKEGWQDLFDFHDRVLGNIHSALNVMMTKDIDAARALVVDKDTVRRIEQELQRKHLRSLQAGAMDSIETSNIYQETLRAIKQVNTLFAIIGHPILSETGALLDSRLSG